MPSFKKSNSTDPSKVMVIRDVVPGITTLSLPFELFGGVKAGGRGTIVRLQSGSLAVFSPVVLTPAVQQRVNSLGNLRYIIALNQEHHLFISSWAKEFPGAEVIGMEGLPEKREKNEATRGVKFARVFTPENKRTTRISPEFDAEFEYEYIHSHQNRELVFMHKPTGTLIEADLVFNLPATEQYSLSKEDASSGVLAMAVGKFLNAKGDLTWQKRILWYVSGMRDREGFTESLKRIQGWGFNRIIPCHGDVIEEDGKAVFDRASEYFLDGNHSPRERPPASTNRGAKALLSGMSEGSSMT